MAKALRAVFLILALALLAGVPAVASAKTESSGGAPMIMAQQAAPSVSLAAAANVQVRLNSPVSVTATFSEPVSGFTVADVTVMNGTASNLAGSDGDAVYTFDVTPDSHGEVTVDIADGVATNGESNGNTAARQLSLGIPYDFDGSGEISNSELFAAIDDYFDGLITIAETFAVIELYFSSPAEPEPGPSDDCIQTVSSDGTVNGQWASGCDSATRSGSHARYYTFTLDASSEVTVRLESTAANTYLYLRAGEAQSGTALHEDNDGGGGTNSQIQETLGVGSYTVEAITYNPGETGSFTLTVSGLGGTGVPDLVVGTPTVSNSIPKTGRSFTLSATVRNQGSGSSGSTTLRYYRSTDSSITSSDTSVGTDAVGALAPSGSSDQSVSLTAPSSTGTYYYGACVDSVSDESDTANNCSASVTVDVEQEAVTAAITECTAETVGAETIITIAGTIRVYETVLSIEIAGYVGDIGSEEVGRQVFGSQSAGDSVPFEISGPYSGTLPDPLTCSYVLVWTQSPF